MAPSHRRGPWVPEEDQLLLQLVREQGPNNWVRISQHMHYRSPKQCRERFHQNLKPSLNREPISADEGLLIERMVNEMGKRWAEIARRLGNRSDNAVKNWWNGSMNRKRRGLSTPPASRTFNGRIEAPFARASIVSPSRPRFATRPWAESTCMESSEAFSHSRRESTVSTARQLSPIYTLPSINRPIETPLTSPAFSEASHASIEPPSMVSDHNSVCSSSPRTLPSPQLLPMPVDVRGQYDVRRPSVASVHVVDDSPPSYPSRSLESLSELASKRQWMEHQPAMASWHQPMDSLPKPWETDPVEPPRDTRMGVNNLLN
ncbi:MYB family conidiophore development protein FlbD [Penicillium brasilianum]|uniref:MYB family conidiophore development protein FlbD n=1 Tax=Penicillium brasilianum TaxID=104259 RepID=A0A1S9RK09_PENBI|nr:MYB family conidiophore development protein FlbD [Penicillium brasilianum]